LPVGFLRTIVVRNALTYSQENNFEACSAFLEISMSDNSSKPSRRGFFFGAAATGAAAAVVVALPGVPALDAAPQAPKPAPEKGGGYSLSDHVKRYYKTARI
jgi:hypothetical protein